MGITDAKRYIGKRCDVRWLDRMGQELQQVSTIHDVTYVPMYGGYLILDTEDIPLEKVVAVSEREIAGLAVAA